MSKGRKFIYPVGIISLIGLTFMLPAFLKKNLPKQEYVISYLTPQEIKTERWIYSFSKFRILDDIKTKRKIKITLDDDSHTNRKKINFIREEAQRIKYTNDTSTVLLITIEDGVSYGEFISLLNICLMDDQKRYAAYEDKFVIFGEPPKKFKENGLTYFTCESVISPDKAAKRPFIGQLSDQLKKDSAKDGIILISGWLLLTLSSIYFLKRNSLTK